MAATRKSSRGLVVGWTLGATALSVLLMLLVNTIAFQRFGHDVLITALVLGVALPLLTVMPAVLGLALRVADLSRVNRQLKVAAATDPLTACLNRGAFVRHVERQLSDGQAGALLVIDADHFKSINDRFGHDEGDAALTLIAGAMRSVLRAGDAVGRLGGEEFGVYLAGVSPRLGMMVAERIRRAVNLIVFAPGGRLEQLSVSIGGADTADSADFEALFHIADQRLYVAKRLGRNRVEMGTEDPGGLMPDIAIAAE